MYFNVFLTIIQEIRWWALPTWQIYSTSDASCLNCTATFPVGEVSTMCGCFSLHFLDLPYLGLDFFLVLGLFSTIWMLHLPHCSTFISSLLTSQSSSSYSPSTYPFFSFFFVGFRCTLRIWMLLDPPDWPFGSSEVSIVLPFHPLIRT